MRKALLLMITLITAFSTLVWAGTTGKLTGKVTDKRTKEPLAFVTVLVEGTKLGATTDANGDYVILNIPPGKYNIRAQYIGYAPSVIEGVSVSVDLTTTKNVELSETSVELNTVVIQAEATKLQKDITSSQSSVSADQISTLPVAELNDVIELQAGVTKDANGDFHIRGGRSSEVAYWVNGISVTDVYDNSRGIDIDNSSVQELQVISGTFNAEYGNAMSGIVNTVTKEGGSDFHGDLRFYGSDHVSNFSSYFPHINRSYNPARGQNLQASLSGPVPFTDKKLNFFVNGRYVYDDGYLYGTRRYQVNGSAGDNSIAPMNWSRRYIGQANLSYWLTQNIKMNVEGLYSKDNYQDYDHAYRYNPDGNVNKYSNSYNGTYTLTHMLSSSTFYTFKGSYFFKDFKEYLYNDPLDPRYMHPDSLSTVSYAFLTKGTNLHRFFRQTDSYSGKFDFTSQVSTNHLLKFGLEAKAHRLQFDDYTLQPLTKDGVQVIPFVPSIPDPNTPNRTKYDNKPLEASAYLQDKIEYQNVIINIGLRLDYFNSRGKVLVDPTDPNPNIALRPDLASLPYEQRLPYYYKDAKAKWQLSPRFGIAYPISASGVIHFSYGHFLQIPPFQYLYNRGQFLVPETGGPYGVYGNPDLEAQKTVMYELGFRQEVFNEFVVDATGFYRDVRNWITAGPNIQTKNLVLYSYYVNKDYENVKGITINLSKRFSNYYSVDLNYTYQVAEGSNSNPDDEFYAATSGNEPQLSLNPMDWDQRHLLNANVYFGYENWGASLTARYGTGLPYTPSLNQFESELGRASLYNERNSRTRPYQFVLDLKVDRTFELAGLKWNAFLRVFNLLDARTVVNVFSDTGEPDFTLSAVNVAPDANRHNTVEEYLRYPTFYGEPRQVQLGLELSF
ncbi:MAG: TonB-dependent receptor [Bacteroidota bacterium]|nr:TonB-dependent receptor [Bacteroidota bacterium]MDP4191086.1 TonB-dependent receptor [Bacteroidota bacterium]MDP4196231.1 TonB-dependent receptor [Bacteroidota bacterium]